MEKEDTQQKQKKHKQRKNKKGHDSDEEPVEYFKILDSKELLELAKNERKLKIISSDVPYGDNQIILKDISIAQKGDDEDRIFALNNHLYKNIRRGNSILEFLNEKKQVDKQIICRKGLQKFFDIYLEYLDLDKAEGDFSSSWVNTNKYFNKLKERTLFDVKKALNNEKKMHVYKLGKANGENAQISYVKECDSWVMASKNVSLLARNKEDLNQYSQQRFQFAILIAIEWFAILDKLTQEQINNLKLQLNQRTMVGEYCGNIKYQHLVKYKQIDLHFYAIVENNQEVTCIPPEQAYTIFDQFKFTQVPITHFQVTNWKQFNLLIFDIYKKVGSSTIEEEGEGSVLYFVEETQDCVQKTLALCKVKTLEYRIYRKLREKLKTSLARPNDDVEKWYRKFCSETQELCQFVEAAKPLPYYFSIAKAAFSFIEKNLTKSDRAQISTRYITFLDVVKKCVDQKTEINKQLLQQEFSQIPLTKEELEEIEDDSKKQHLSNDEEEEQKDVGKHQQIQVEETKEIGNKQNKIEEDFKKYCRIVLLTPPFYIDDQTQQTILKTFNLKLIEGSWSQDKSIIDQQIAIANIHMIPKVNDAKICKNTFFLIIGFSESGFERTKELINQQQNNAEAITNQQIKPYLENQDIKLFLHDQSEKVNQFKQKLQQLLPDNFEVIDDIFMIQSEEDNKKIYNKDKGQENLNIKLLDTVEKIQKIEYNQKQEKVQQKDKKKKSKSQKDLIVFICSTIPSTGKSTFLKHINEYLQQHQELEIGIRSISSDDIRNKCMEELKQRNKGKKISQDELFKKTQDQAVKIFRSNLIQMLQETEQQQTMKNIIFVDKNHPPNSLNQITELIRENCPGYIRYKIVLIIPKCVSTFNADKFKFPFSLTFLLNCIIRCIEREEHQTLTGSPVKKLGIILMFYNFFRNVSFNQYSIKKYDIDYALEIPFHDEQKDSDDQIPIVLVKEITQVLKTMRSNDDFESDYNIANLLGLIMSQKFQFKNCSQDIQLQEFLKGVNTVFNQYSNEKTQQQQITEQTITQ